MATSINRTFGAQLVWIALGMLFVRTATVRLMEAVEEIESIPFRVALPMFDSQAQTFHPSDPDYSRYGIILDLTNSSMRIYTYRWTNLAFDTSPESLDEVDEVKVFVKETNGLLSSSDPHSLYAVEYAIREAARFIRDQVPRPKRMVSSVLVLAAKGTPDKLVERILATIGANSGGFAKLERVSQEQVYQLVRQERELERMRWARRKARQQQGDSEQVALRVNMSDQSIHVMHRLTKSMHLRALGRLKTMEAQGTYAVHMTSTRGPHNPRKASRTNSIEFRGFGGEAAHDAYERLLIHKFKNRSFMQKFASLFCSRDTSPKRENSHDNSELAEVSQLEDPCAPRGYQSSVLQRPRWLLEPNVSVLNSTRPDNGTRFSYQLHGTGSYNKCKQLLGELLTLAKAEHYGCDSNELKTCPVQLLGEHFVPFETIRYMNEQGGHISYWAHRLLQPEIVYDLAKNVPKIQALCVGSRAQLLARFSGVDEQHLMRGCFESVWLETFLTKGLLMPFSYKLATSAA